MADADDKKPPRQPGRRGGGGKRASGGDVGDVLKSVYDRALKEEIPREMLDLLGKLD